MSTRFRKSVTIGGGLRLNVGKTGVGVSAGTGGARYSVHSSGRTTKSVGIPGTGLGYVSSSGGGGSRRPAAHQTVTGAAAAGALAKPGFFAGAAEKAYYRGLAAYLSGDKERAITEFETVLTADPSLTSADLFAAFAMSGTVHSDQAQIVHLEAVVRSETPFPDRMMAKFLPPDRAELTIAVRLTESVTASVPVSPLGASLVLAEAYQATGRLDDAIGLVQQLHEVNRDDHAIRLSLADLLFADGDYDGVVEVTAGVANADDLTVATLHIRGAALYAQGHQTAALDAFRDALAKTRNRSPGLLLDVRYDRALALEAAGHKAKARADFERLYAADPNYHDVRDRLAAL